MAQTTFSGPVVSQNGVSTTTLTTTSAVFMLDLPTSDPSVAGALWNNAGVLNISAG